MRPLNPIELIESLVKNFRVQAKALAAFFQISSYIGFNFSITFPNLVDKIFSHLAVINLNIIPSLGYCFTCCFPFPLVSTSLFHRQPFRFFSRRLQCSFASFDYIHSVTLMTLSPIAVALFLFFVYALVTRNRHSQLEKKLHVPHELEKKFKKSELKRLRVSFSSFDDDDSCYISEKNIELALQKTRKADDSTQDSKKSGETVSKLLIAAKLKAENNKGLSFVNFLKLVSLNKDLETGETPDEKSMTLDVKAFMDLNNKLQSQGSGFDQTIFYAFLLLTFLVLISTSTALFHYFKVNSSL